MAQGLVRVLSGVLVGLMCSAPAAWAAGDQDYIDAYVGAKPAPGGITPGTASEFATCWMVWSRMGQLAVDTNDGLVEIHNEWSITNIDTLFQHWWQRAEDAYDTKYESSGESRLLKDAQEKSDYYHDTTKTLELMTQAGVCYVPENSRATFDKPRALTAYLDGARTPQVQSVAAELPENMSENMIDGTIAINKKRKFKGLQKVLVPHFAVSFGLADSAKAGAKSRNIFGAGASVSASARLTGLTEALLQKITDAAFQDFKNQMAASGYDVIAGPEAQQRLLQTQKMRHSKIFDGPVNDMSVYHFAFNGNFKDITFSPTGMKLINPLWEASMATKQLDIPSLNVQYSVHFAWFDGSSDYDRRAFSGNEAMAASMGTNLNVQVIYSSGIEILGDTANNPKVSVDGTYYSTASFADNVDVSDSGGGSRKRQELVVTANQDAYYRESIKSISRANTGLISQMAAQR